MSLEGTEFGRYTLVRKVGAGGMAEIWKARVGGLAGFEKVFAIKKVLPQLVEEQGGGFIDLFIEEAKLAAQLVHPNIVQVFDFGRIGKRDYYIAMEYVAGANLARVVHRLLEDGEKVPLHCALYIVAEAARGLGYAHAKTDGTGKPLKIVHRDVSPQNLLISYTGEVKVADFGIAKVASAMSLTAEGTVRGKISYMSPEQANAKPLDNRSDIFALGIVLWELLAGKRMFGGAGQEAFSKVLAFQGLVNEYRTPIPKELQALLESMLAVSPDLRYPDCASVEAALAMNLGGGASVEARAMLGSIVRRLFAEEFSAETGSVPVEQPSASSPASEQDRTVTHTTPSNPTLAPAGKDSTVIVKNRSRSGAAVLEPPPSATATDTARASEGGFPAERPAPFDRRLAIGATVLGIAIAIGFFAGGKLIGLGDSSTPEPTTFALETEALPTETPAAPQTSTPAKTAAPVTTRVAVSPRPTATVAVVRATATPAPTPTAAPKRMGSLVITARPWCDVAVDGKPLGRAERPQQVFRVPAGSRVVRLTNSAASFTKDVRIEVPADGEMAVSVDAKAGTVAVRSR